MRMLKDVQTLRGHNKPVSSLAFHPQQHDLFVSGSEDGNIFYWMIGYTCRLRLSGRARFALSVACSPLCVFLYWLSGLSWLMTFDVFVSPLLPILCMIVCVYVSE